VRPGSHPEDGSVFVSFLLSCLEMFQAKQAFKFAKAITPVRRMGGGGHGHGAPAKTVCIISPYNMVLIAKSVQTSIIYLFYNLFVLIDAFMR
jgi:hypothetical protein